MNIFKNLTQGSEEWLSVRLSHFTASEASAMLGISKYMSRNQLLDLKKTGIAKEVDESTQKLFDQGHHVEELARPIAESIIGEDLYPVTASLDVDEVKLLASFDGLTLLNDVVWENKLLNKGLKESLSLGVIPDQYKPQLQQQLMVSGASKALFMASDGTEENTYYAWYESDEALANELISSWKQFAKDLATHEVKAKEEKLVAQELQSLPKLEVSLVGNVSNSNLVEYKTTALAFIKSINTDLQSDQDFVDAEKAVKFFTNGEKELEAVKERALSDTADIKTLFDTIDQLKEEMRQKRLTLNKLVKTRKEEIRSEIAFKAKTEFSSLLIATSKNLNGIQITQVVADFDGAMKGKKTVESLQNAVDTELARCKIELAEISELVRANLNSLSELAGEHKFLFSDYAQIIFKDNEDLTNLIKSRIAEHEEAEAKRKQLEQEQMQAAAKEKAEREAQAKIDAQAEQIRQEERAKAKAEQEEQNKLAQAEAAKQATEEVQQTTNKEVSSSPVNEAVQLANQLIEPEQTQVYRTIGDYEPLELWPSDIDLAENEQLAIICQKLEEAETYIELLTKKVAA
jgi:putative phage-type endonuclease